MAPLGYVFVSVFRRYVGIEPLIRQRCCMSVTVRLFIIFWSRGVPISLSFVEYSESNDRALGSRFLETCSVRLTFCVVTPTSPLGRVSSLLPATNRKQRKVLNPVFSIAHMREMGESPRVSTRIFIANLFTLVPIFYDVAEKIRVQIL